MTEATTTYERITVPKFREILRETGVDLMHGVYFEDYDTRTEGDKRYTNCEACLVGTLCAYYSWLPPEKIAEKIDTGKTEFTVEEVKKLIKPLPIEYIAGLEQGFEVFDGRDGLLSEGEYDMVNDSWTPKIDITSEDYKRGKVDGRRIRRSYNLGTL